MGNCCDNLLPRQLLEMHNDLAEIHKPELQTELSPDTKEKDIKNNEPDHHPTAMETLQSFPGAQQLQALGNMNHQFQDNVKLIIKKMLPNETIVSIQNTFFDQISKHRHSLTKIKDGNFPEFTEAASYAENVSKESGFEVLNVLMQTYKSTFSPEFELFGYLNQEVSLHHSLDQYELVHQEAYEDIIFLVERVRTQKIFIIASRHIIALRIIRKLPGGRILDVSQSIEHNDLVKYPTLRAMYEDKVLKEPASVLVAGRYFEIKDGKCQVTAFSKLDFHSSIPLKFAAIFMKKTFDEFFLKLDQNLKTHLDKDVWNSRQEIIWFRCSQTQELLKPNFVEDKGHARLAQQNILPENATIS